MVPQHFSFLSGCAGIFGPFLRYESGAFNDCRNLVQWQTAFFQTVRHVQDFFIDLFVALGKQFQIEALGGTGSSLFPHTVPQVSILEQHGSAFGQRCPIIRGYQHTI